MSSKSLPYDTARKILYVVCGPSTRSSCRWSMRSSLDPIPLRFCSSSSYKVCFCIPVPRICPDPRANHAERDRGPTECTRNRWCYRRCIWRKDSLHPCTAASPHIFRIRYMYTDRMNTTSRRCPGGPRTTVCHKRGTQTAPTHKNKCLGRTGISPGISLSPRTRRRALS